MVDVDQCTRYAEEGLCGDAMGNALKISEIPNDFRNVIFRNKGSAQIQKMLEKFSETIKKSVSNRYGFACKTLKASSDNNRDGADLYCTNTATGEHIIIEVKFGSYTDKAVGMENFSQIFGTDIFKKTLSNDVRKRWAELVASEYPDLSKQALRSSVALNDAVNIFNSEMAKKDYTLTKPEQCFMEDYLINNSGSYESKSNNYIRFETDKSGSRIIEVVPVVKGLGKWKIREVRPIGADDDKSRVNVLIINEETGVEIKFVLNNKNDYRIKRTDIKIRSKYMINSPSWNVWIRKL